MNVRTESTPWEPLEKGSRQRSILKPEVGVSRSGAGQTMRAGLELSYNRRLLAESQCPGIQRQSDAVDTKCLCTLLLEPGMT